MVSHSFDGKFHIDIKPFNTACDWTNEKQNIHSPIYGILCDGESFEFFMFDGSTKPYSFSRGCFPGDPPAWRRGLRISDFTLADTCLSCVIFARCARPSLT
jgi:hypothetical protein